MDVRTRAFCKIMPGLQRAGGQGYISILFLEADEGALIRRFSQTRRQHPLADHDSVSHALRQERESLKGLRQMAHRISTPLPIIPINCANSSSPNIPISPERRMALHLTSFAYKNGIPPEADLVIDVRFLPNPILLMNSGLYRQRTASPGICPETRGNPGVYHPSLDFVDFLLPLYQKEGKTHLNIAIGCTGGQHRSVVIANYLGEHLAQKNFSFSLTIGISGKRGE